MTPSEYEQIVAQYFDNLGYKTKVTSQGNDYGVDVFGTKGKSKIAIQAKMFGGCSRKINRQMIMELHGAKDYFECDTAFIATNGEIISNAKEVADKLKIRIINIPAIGKVIKKKENKDKTSRFDEIWEKHVMPLQGKTLIRDNGKKNKILKVDGSGIVRSTSNNKKQTIKIEIFRFTINYILKHGSITRKHINDEYIGRASSGIVLILSNTPVFELTNNPVGLKLK